MDHVRVAVLEKRRRLDAKGVLAVSVACVREILSELIRRERHQILFAIPKIDTDLGIWLVFVPNPARNLVAIGLLDSDRMMRQWHGANAAGKNEQPEANKVKSYENSCRAPNRAVAPTALHFIPGGKNVER